MKFRLPFQEKSSILSEKEETWIFDIRSTEDIHNKYGLSNKISTTKYTLLTWLPISIMSQFRRVANVYFVFVSVLMIIGTYAPQLFQSPLDPWSTVMALVIVLLVTSVKEGYEDYQRSCSDKYENTKKVTIVKYNPTTQTFFEYQIQTQFLKAGDIIKMTGRTNVPVDLLILLTSNYKDGNQCYIETSNIDGETNLKLREAPSSLLPLVKSLSSGSLTTDLCQGNIECEAPNKNIHNFEGTLKLDTIQDKPISLSADNIILRSAILSNTDWCYGIALYTGQETKIQMNNRQAASKMSKLENYLNKAIVFIFIAQCTLVTMAVISIYLLGWNNIGRLPYVYPNNEGRGSVLPIWLEYWFIFLLLFNNFIPISLYITIELVNLGQSYMIGSDILMYDEQLDVPCTVRSSNLAQELGMVSNIFSDKTGTLTRNEMKLVKFVVDGVMYDVPHPPPLNTSNSGNMSSSSSSFNCPNTPKAIQLNVNTPKNDSSLKEFQTTTTLNSNSNININSQLQELENQRQHILKKAYTDINMNKFLLCLTTCHTVVRESDGTYRAESPDELALLQGVELFDCGIVQRSTATMTINMCNNEEVIEVLAVNAFNADRKRMSILLKQKLSTGKSIYSVMCKGADNILLDICKIDVDGRKSLEKSLLDLAVMGLRTLCVAYKPIDEETALAWHTKFCHASTTLINRSETLAQVAAELEIDMKIVGVTAIEDRLQEEVPEVIADLTKAGIIIWMLTGDKEETAVNIGFSCNLILKSTKLFFIVKLSSEEEYTKCLRDVYMDIQEHTGGQGKAYQVTSEGEKTTTCEVALVMDGPSFRFFNNNNVEHRKWLLCIGQASRSVIACRLTPVQKQELVALVKKDSVPRATCLSIGDGANDVSMIREADVGVGIFGKEGRQAANNADFAIGKFKYLKRLMLVHGRLNYSRQCRVFLYSMHKNMVVTFTLFWYNYLAATSGTSMYDSWVYTSYNFALGLPIVCYGFMNFDLSPDFCMKYPQVYSTGRTNVYLSSWSVFGWIINAVVYGVVICLIFFIAYYKSFVDWGLYEMGTTIFTGTVMALQAKVSFLHDQWNYIQIIAILISICGLLLFLLVLNTFLNSVWSFYGVAYMIYSTNFYWLMGFFTLMFITVLIDVCFYYTVYNIYPSKEMLYTDCYRNECIKNRQTHHNTQHNGNSSSQLLTHMTSQDNSKNSADLHITIDQTQYQHHSKPPQPLYNTNTNTNHLGSLFQFGKRRKASRSTVVPSNFGDSTDNMLHTKEEKEDIAYTPSTGSC